MNKIKNFFIWCSGASVEIVNKCDDKERTKYTNVGIIVLAVALLSTLSSTYFLSFAFNTISTAFSWIYFPVGIIWGFIILSLDRAIVSTINKNDKLITQIFKAIPRFLLALTIGIIVATPLEFKIFEKEINTIIYDEAKVIVKNNIEENFEKELTLWTNKVEETNKTYNEYKEMYLNEVEGRKSGIPGKGARANEYMKYELNTKILLEQYKDSLDKINEKIIEYQKSFDIEEEVYKYVAANIGILERVETLYGLGYIHTILTFLFVLIETLPVLIKLMSPKGSYDDITLNESKLYIEKAKTGLENTLLSLTQSSEIKAKEKEYQLKELDDKYNREKEFSDREFKNKMDKAEIDFNNELKLHELKSTYHRINEESKYKENSKNIKSLIKTSDDGEIRVNNKYWRLKENNDIIYYFDIEQDKKMLQKPLYYFHDGEIDLGKWHFKFDGNLRYIITSLNNKKHKLLIKELTSNTLQLKEDDKIMNFESVSYI